MKKFKGISVVLVLATLLQMFTGIVSYAQGETRTDQENYPVWYLRESFGSASSWDKARAWNGSNTNTGSGLNGVELADDSTAQKSEAYRALNDIDSGVITLDFDFRVDRYCDNVAFRLLNDETTVFGIVTKGTNIYLEQPGNTTEYISNYTPSVINKDKVNYIVAHIDMDNKNIIDIYVDGVKCIENKPFANDADKINGFDVETDEVGKVVLTNQRIHIYKGYIVMDDFFNNREIKPIGWEFEKNGGTLSVYTANNRNVDRYSMQMNTSQGGIKATKKFDAEGGHLVFETSVLQPKNRDGITISVNSGNDSVMSVTTDGTNFKYNSQSFYNYMDNVWYVLKFDMDLNNKTAKLYLNNKLKLENIKLNYSSIDNITIEAGQNDIVTIVDDVKLYHPFEYPDDYVPEPVKPEKVDDTFLFGMQMCPLWTEGLYTKSWDYVKAAPDRMPILGAYDEGNPEVNDWEIKWLIDHGFDFQWVCTYPSYQMNFSKTAIASPTKPDMVREGNSLYEGFMNAKYSEDFKFAICMENSFLTQGTAIRDYFYDVVVPYWIEYYFKDDRYLKIDGRPVMSVLVMDSFLNMFEGTDGLTGTESIKAGVDKFRQMCIDAGVGNPYITDQPTQNGYSGKAYTYYSQCGIDGTAAYGYNQKMTLGQQRQTLENGLSYGEPVGVETVPCLAPRRGDDPWLNGTNETGFKSTTEEFDHTLEWVKDKFGGASQTELSKQLVMLATWDEYGEGHCLCPSVGDGFKYLDCVRRVFCKDYEHEEAIPTENQKERVNKLVVQDRKPGFMSDASVVGQVLENTTPEIPTTVKHIWDFTKSAGQEWVVESGIGENSITPEGWVIQPSNTTPTIAFGKKVSYDISDVTYIKVRMKQSLSSTGGYAYWITSTAGEYDTKNMACHMPSSVDGVKEFKDYYIPVGEKIRWKGNLTGLKINLGVVTDTTDNFVVESIAFLSDDELTNATKVSMDGANCVLNPAPVVKNGVVMVPLREITTILGINVENYARTNSYLILGQNPVIVTEGSTSAKKNNTPIALQEAPYRVSDIVNDTVYVPLNTIADTLGRKATYDQGQNVIDVESSKQKVTTVQRKVLGEISGGDAEAFYNLDGVNKMTYQNGITIMECGGYPTPLSRKFAGIKLEDVKVVAFKFTSSSAGQMNFLWNSSLDNLITADKASRKVLVSAGENYIEEPTDTLFGWEGTADIFRFQPPAGKTIEIEWIRFLGDPIVTSGEEEIDMSPCITYTDEYLSWELDENTVYDGWTQNKNIGNMEIKSGALSFSIVGANPRLITAGNVAFDASKVTSIDIVLKNNTQGETLKLYYMKKGEKEWDNNNVIELAIKPNDQYDNTYHIDTTKYADWNGIINNLMLSFEGRKGDISIDYIRLNYATE